MELVLSAGLPAALPRLEAQRQPAVRAAEEPDARAVLLQEPEEQRDAVARVRSAQRDAVGLRAEQRVVAERQARLASRPVEQEERADAAARPDASAG